MPKYTVLDTEGRWDHTTEDEWLWWPRVLWMDPGVVSGVATVWFDPAAVFEGKTLAKCVLAYSEIFLSGPEDGINGQANRYLRIRRALDAEAGLVTGIESFTIRQMNMDWEFLAPVRLRAMVEFGMSIDTEQRSPVLHVQSPSDAIGTFNNDRLRSQRMYTPGPDHVNDAKRHALLWIRKLRQRGMDGFREAHGWEEGWFA